MILKTFRETELLDNKSPALYSLFLVRGSAEEYADRSYIEPTLEPSVRILPLWEWCRVQTGLSP